MKSSRAWIMAAVAAVVVLAVGLAATWDAAAGVTIAGAIVYAGWVVLRRVAFHVRHGLRSAGEGPAAPPVLIPLVIVGGVSITVAMLGLVLALYAEARKSREVGPPRDWLEDSFERRHPDEYRIGGLLQDCKQFVAEMRVRRIEGQPLGRQEFAALDRDIDEHPAAWEWVRADRARVGSKELTRDQIRQFAVLLDRRDHDAACRLADEIMDEWLRGTPLRPGR